MPLIITLAHKTNYYTMVGSLQKSFPQYSARAVKRSLADGGKWLSHAAHEGPIDALPGDFEVGIFLAAKENGAAANEEIKQWLHQKTISFSEIL